MKIRATHGQSSSSGRDGAGAASMLERSLVDDLVRAYVEWREEAIAVWQVHGWWAGAGSEAAACAYAAYHAALDREEAAATVYANLVAAAGRLLTTGRNPASIAGGPPWRR